MWIWKSVNVNEKSVNMNEKSVNVNKIILLQINNHTHLDNWEEFFSTSSKTVLLHKQLRKQRIFYQVNHEEYQLFEDSYFMINIAQPIGNSFGQSPYCNFKMVPVETFRQRGLNCPCCLLARSSNFTLPMLAETP